MLSRFKKPTDAEKEEDGVECIIPAGRTYILKRANRMPVFARSKKDKAAEMAVDPLRAVVGIDGFVRYRKKPPHILAETAPEIMNRVAYVPEQQHLLNTSSFPLQLCFTCIPTNLGLSVPEGSLIQYPQLLSMYSHPQYSTLPQRISHISGVISKNSDQCKSISPSFNNIATTTSSKASIHRTPITVKKHLCGHCGRLRSRKYHHDHPIMQGEEPTPAFCGKCQRDASSSDDDNGPRETRKNVKKNKGKQRCLWSSSGDDDDPSQSLELNNPVKFKTSQDQRAKQITPEDDIILREKHSAAKGIQEPRGRLSKRIVIEHYVDHRTSSPAKDHLAVSKSVNNYEPFQKNKRTARNLEAVYDLSQSKCPSSRYRNIEKNPSQCSIDYKEQQTCPRKFPNRFENEENMHRNIPVKLRLKTDEEETLGRRSHCKNDYIEHDQTSRKTKQLLSLNSRLRRGYNRLFQASNLSEDDINGKNPDKKARLLAARQQTLEEFEPGLRVPDVTCKIKEEERRVYEKINLETINDGSQYAKNWEDKYYTYYRDDWAKQAKSESFSEHSSYTPHEHEYRRDHHQIDILGGSEFAVDCAGGSFHNLPRAPTPPQVRQQWQDRPLCPPSSKSGVRSHFQSSSANQAARQSSESSVTCYSPRTSEVVSSKTDMSLVCPRHHSRKIQLYDDNSQHPMTNNKQKGYGYQQHVRFRSDSTSKISGSESSELSSQCLSEVEKRVEDNTPSTWNDEIDFAGPDWSSLGTSK